MNNIPPKTPNSNKDSGKSTQIQKILKSLFEAPKTMLMVSRDTGIERASICWAVYNLCNSGRIRFVKYGACAITKRKAGFYTSNPNYYCNKTGTGTTIKE